MTFPVYCPIVGVNYRDPETQAQVRELSLGHKLRLERDPHNEYDANAIQVFLNDDFLGFVPRYNAADLAPIMDSGVSVTAEVSFHDGGLKPVLKISEVPSADTGENTSASAD